MKIKSNNNIIAEWTTVITISLIVSTLVIFHVIHGLAKTPIGAVYLGTGHYYLDYFEYLQHIAAGMAGSWAPMSYQTTDPTLLIYAFSLISYLGKSLGFFICPRSQLIGQRFSF